MLEQGVWQRGQGIGIPRPPGVRLRLIDACMSRATSGVRARAISLIIALCAQRSMLSLVNWIACQNGTLTTDTKRRKLSGRGNGRTTTTP
jgi:hypothetical protein